MSCLIPFFFMQHRYPKMNVSSTCFLYSASSSSLSAANSRSSSSFCATKRSFKSSLCFFFIETSVRSCLTSPFSWAISSAASCRRSAADSSLLFAQPNPPGGLHFLFVWWISQLQPLPVSGAAGFRFLYAERQRSSYNQWSAADQKRDRGVGPCHGDHSPADTQTSNAKL